ncbi:RHS repeat-associated core domain-containing protein [Pseudomonas aeruginosa]|nr:RHS repeat-associated core domain-containing protein [Pseudomonas aeruginosa]
MRFPGQFYDAESGLHYNYFRDYDPETGRYVESDPIGA